LETDDLQVVEYDDTQPSIRLANGDVHTADIVIAVDGKSPLQAVKHL
jgi:hypothetical protein